LRAGSVEPTQERQGQRAPGGVRHRKRRDRRSEAGSPRGGRGVVVGTCAARARRDDTKEEERGEADRQRQGLEAEDVPGLAGVIPSPAA
jgi:hypothetical protein